MKQNDTTAIGTERLTLRLWRETDAEVLFELASDERVSKPAMWPRHTSEEMSLEVIRDVFAPNPHCFAMVMRQNDCVAGCMGLVPEGYEHYPALPGEREVGYWVGRRYWGAGLTPEALRGLIAYCRDELGLNSLLITTGTTNRASQRVAEKCGFERVAEFELDSEPAVAYRLRL